MTTLSEQELTARLQAIDSYIDIKDRGLDISERQAFNVGFQAGLAYNKARIDELEAKVKELEEYKKRHNEEWGILE